MRKQIGPTISQESAKALSSSFRTLNQGATYVLDAWPGLYRRTLGELQGRFNKTALLFIASVREQMDAGQGPYLGAELIERAQSLDLTAAVKNLTAFQLHVLDVWASAYSLCDSPEDREAHLAILMEKT